MSSTARGGVREEDDFYETQREDAIEAVERLRPFLSERPTIFEPMAGRGALVRLLREVWPNAYIIANEINPGRAALLQDAGADFVMVGDLFRPTLWEEMPRNVGSPDLAFTNPAFKFAVECVTRLFPRIPHVKILQRTNFLHSKKRLGFWQQNKANIDLLPERPSFAASLACDDHVITVKEGAVPSGFTPLRVAEGKKPKAKRAGCDWAVIQYLDAPRAKTCPNCGNPVRCSTSDSCEYMWAHFFNSATRTFHHLGSQVAEQGLLKGVA